VSVEAVDASGEPRNNLRLRCQIVAPDLSTTEITLDQTAAGEYEGEFQAVGRGAYLVNIAADDDQTRVTTGAVNSYSPEFNIVSQDVNSLRRVSGITGGQLMPDLLTSDLFTRRTIKTIPHEIWEALILAALILLPLDVGVRRVLITREHLAGAREWINKRMRRASSLTADTAASVSMAKLKDARSRVVLGDGKGEDAAAAASEVGQPRDEASTPRAAPDTADQAKPLPSRLLDAKRKRGD
jgi:hypothetical protein